MKFSLEYTLKNNTLNQLVVSRENLLVEFERLLKIFDAEIPSITSSEQMIHLREVFNVVADRMVKTCILMIQSHDDTLDIYRVILEESYKEYYNNITVAIDDYGALIDKNIMMQLMS